MVILNKYYFESKLNLLENANEEFKSKIASCNYSQDEIKIINHVSTNINELRCILKKIDEKIISHKQAIKLNALFDKAIYSIKPSKDYKKTFDEIFRELDNFVNLPYFPQISFNIDKMVDVFMFQFFYWLCVGVVIYFLGNLIANLDSKLPTPYFPIIIILFVVLSFIFIYYTNRKLTKFLTFLKTITFIKNGVDFINKTPPGYNPQSDRIIEKTISELIKALPNYKNQNHKLF